MAVVASYSGCFQAGPGYTQNHFSLTLILNATHIYIYGVERQRCAMGASSIGTDFDWIDNTRTAINSHAVTSQELCF